MFAQKIASMWPRAGHWGSAALRRMGGNTLERPEAAVRAVICAKHSGSVSVGWKMRWGRLAAKNVACWPVPLAISSTLAGWGRRGVRTARMGCLLRSAAGERWGGMGKVVFWFMVCGKGRPAFGGRKSSRALRVRSGSRG